MINVAIDGPVGAGKSSVARECAKRLGIIYVDTETMWISVRKTNRLFPSC